MSSKRCTRIYYSRAWRFAKSLGWADFEAHIKQMYVVATTQKARMWIFRRLRREIEAMFGYDPKQATYWYERNAFWAIRKVTRRAWWDARKGRGPCACYKCPPVV